MNDRGRDSSRRVFELGAGDRDGLGGGDTELSDVAADPGEVDLDAAVAVGHVEVENVSDPSGEHEHSGWASFMGIGGLSYTIYSGPGGACRAAKGGLGG